MKSSRILNIFLLSSLALTAACADEEPRYEAVTTTLFARMDEAPVTKTFLSGPVSGVYQNLWSDNDEIGIFVGENTVSKFSLKNGAGTPKGEFQGEFKDPNGVSMEKTAVYPFAIVNGKSGTSVNVTLPEEQLYKAGNIADGALPMVAVANGSELNFKNLCSVLKISMTGSLSVNSITFTANNSNIKVSGYASVDTGNTTLTMADNAGSRLVLKCDCVKLSDTATEFFIVVPSQTYTGGFSLIIDTNNGKVLKSITSDVSIKRSELYRITPFECKIDDDNIFFEDDNFKAYMVANFDTDNDGEISREEALAVTKIDVATDNIESLSGIEYMTNLTELNCEGSHVWNSTTAKYEDGGILKSLDVTKNTKLTKLFCGFNQLSSIDLTSNVKLERLRCAGNDINRLDVSKNTGLTHLTAYNNNLSSIDVRNNTKLEVIDLSNNQIKSIDISKNKSLTTFHCDDNLLTELDPSKNSELTVLFCDKNKISEIDISNNPELTYLSCEENKISELDLSKNTKLVRVSVNDNILTSLTVNSCPRIEILSADNNLIKEMDISDLVTLYYFHCIGNPLATLYIFEGQVDTIPEMLIPSTTDIVVKGKEQPEEWAGKEFWHKSLGMRFTATWCGYCPNLAEGFAKAVSQYPNKIELLNLHPTSSNLGFSGTSALVNVFKVTRYPTGMIDHRTLIENYSSDYAAKLIVNSAKETENNYPVKTGISFSSSVSGSTVNLNVKLYIKEKGDYKVTAVLLEDNIIGYQNGGGDSYNHSNIARVAFSDITGDAVTTSENNKTVSKSYTATIPSSCDKNNLRVLVYVLKKYGSQTIIRTDDYGDYYVDNAVSAAIGTTQDLVFSDGTVYGGNEDTKDGGEITLK